MIMKRTNQNEIMIEYQIKAQKQLEGSVQGSVVTMGTVLI